MNDTVYDICVIGSGPAGLTLCAELINSGKKICILESGKKEKTKYADNLKEIENSGEIEVKTSSRERILGGTSTTWTGLSAPMDEIDLEKWPIKMSELKTYYEKCNKYGFPEFKDFYTEPSRSSNDSSRNYEKLQEKVFIANIPAWNFAEKLKYIFDNQNVELFTDSTVIKLNSEKINEQSRVTSAVIKKSDGKEYEIFAKTFVIATGGIETPRLLLLSNLGNEYDQVGRYIMNHPKKAYGFVHFKKPMKDLPYFFKKIDKGFSKYSGLRLKDDIQKSLGLLNSYVRFEEVYSWKDKIIHRLFPWIDIPVKKVRVWNFMEMKALAENRIVLSEKKDTNGIQIPNVVMNTSNIDKKSLIELHKTLAEEFEKDGIAVLESNIEKENPWPITTDASHHIGGTIMGNDPRNSVVNKDLKVHSISNLYITSSSVFPTSGNANPTYTICALSIRLAKKLSGNI